MAKKFTKQQREIMARKLGYEGPMNMFDQFVKSDPAMERKYNTVVEKYMARGGMVKKYAEGGVVTPGTNYLTAPESKIAQDLQAARQMAQSIDTNLENKRNAALQEYTNQQLNSEMQQIRQFKQPEVDMWQSAIKNLQDFKAGKVSSVRVPSGYGKGYGADIYTREGTPPEYVDAIIAPIQNWINTLTNPDVIKYDALERLHYKNVYGMDPGPMEGNLHLAIPADVGDFNTHQQQRLNDISNAFRSSVPGLRNSDIEIEAEKQRQDMERNIFNPIFDAIDARFKTFSQETLDSIYGPGSVQAQVKAPTTTPTTATPTTPTTTTPTGTTGTTTPTTGGAATPTGTTAEQMAGVTGATPTTTTTPTGTTPTTTATGTTPATTSTTTPTTTGTAAGTTATTTAPVGTTTPTIPTAGVPGGGISTTTQSGPIPTTNTVPSVNIPQVTAATIPSTPEQLVSTTGAPTQAAQIAGATVPGVAQVTPTTPQAAATMEATTATGAVAGELAGLQPEQGAVSQQAQVQAATMEPTSTALKDLQAAQGVAGQVTGAPTRELVAGELIEGPTVDRAAVEATLAQNEAAQGVVTEDMTVQGQLAKLTSNFEANNPPAWAAGALRNATAVMAQRGLAASSLAGQALIQATIESALPIASADAQIYREMGIQNLTNKQQMAVLSAQQRAAFLGQEFDQAFQTRVTNAATISEIANLNFSAKQQIALENARLTESVNLANLNNRQALVMANAAQIATLETANLNNRQQANVLNAQAFLQMDLTNLSNRQQTALFKSQSMIQSILSDQAAENAAKQFNASSINQVNQFYDGLTAQIKQFNATQANAMNQFNVSQINSVAEFNATQQNARDQFNAEYRRIIDQSNAEWRRNIALADTAAINRANEVNATAALGITTIEYNNLWQTYRDQIEYAWKTGENALDRENELARQVLAKQATIEAAKFQIEAAKYQALGSLAAQVFDKGGIAASIGGLIQGAAGSLAAGFVGIKNAITGSSTGYTVLPNTAKPGETGYGWTFASDGTNDIKIAPDGTTYYNGVEQDYNYGYGSSGYNQPDFEFLDNPNQDNYGYGEAPDMSIQEDNYIFPTD